MSNDDGMLHYPKSWDQWPYYPKSLTDMLGPGSSAAGEGERFISLLVTGWCEVLQRPIIVIEPELNDEGELIYEQLPNSSDEEQLKLRRIDHINPRKYYSSFCEHLRKVTNQDIFCTAFDEYIARKLIIAANNGDENLDKYMHGYSCRANMIDQAALIRFRNTPVAVVFSGQFFPDKKEEQQKVYDFINESVKQGELTFTHATELRVMLGDVETPQEFEQSFMNNPDKKMLLNSRQKNGNKLNAGELFQSVVNEIEAVVCSQFLLLKRKKEDAFRNQLSRMFNTPKEDRQSISDQMNRLLEYVRQFCNTDYLALFISPQQYISYPRNANLLEPFAFSGLSEDDIQRFKHFNWRKAGFGKIEKKTLSLNKKSKSSQPFVVESVLAESARQAIKNGIAQNDVRINSGSESIFDDVAIVWNLNISMDYRAVLIWGPISQLREYDIEDEISYLQEISSLIMSRALSFVQLADSIQKMDNWEQISALLSHYARRATSPISSAVEILSDYMNEQKYFDEEDAKDALDSLKTMAEVVSKTIRVPLNSFVGQTEQMYSYDRVSLGEIVKNIVTMYGTEVKKKSINFKIDSQNLYSLPQIEADEGKITDAIGNVIENAIKYSHNNKFIRISCKSFDRYIELKIQDFGQGIPADETHLIYERRYQGRRSKKSSYEEGEGMGLYHARLIIHAHQGKIEYHSRSGPRIRIFKDIRRIHGNMCYSAPACSNGLCLLINNQ